MLLRLFIKDVVTETYEGVLGDFQGLLLDNVGSNEEPNFPGLPIRRLKRMLRASYQRRQGPVVADTSLGVRRGRHSTWIWQGRDDVVAKGLLDSDRLQARFYIPSRTKLPSHLDRCGHCALTLVCLDQDSLWQSAINTSCPRRQHRALYP